MICRLLKRPILQQAACVCWLPHLYTGNNGMWSGKANQAWASITNNSWYHPYSPIPINSLRFLADFGWRSKIGLREKYKISLYKTNFHTFRTEKIIKGGESYDIYADWKYQHDVNPEIHLCLFWYAGSAWQYEAKIIPRDYMMTTWLSLEEGNWSWLRDVLQIQIYDVLQIKCIYQYSRICFVFMKIVVVTKSAQKPWDIEQCGY